MERRRIRFVGHVQGVGFRATARAVASSFALTGWVRNEPDGSVLLEVQGSPSEIEAFLGALRQRLGRLIHHEHADGIAPAPDERGFVIRR